MKIVCLWFPTWIIFIALPSRLNIIGLYSLHQSSSSTVIIVLVSTSWIYVRCAATSSSIIIVRHHRRRLSSSCVIAADTPCCDRDCQPPTSELGIIYGDQIKGMPYQNALFLANLESLKDRRIKLSQSFFKKIYFPLTAACILSCPLNVIMKSSVNYATPQNIQYHTPELKNISPSFQNSM